MEQPIQQKRPIPLKYRIIAAIVAFSLMVSLVANAAVAVRIKPDEESKAAVNYLVDSTGYVNADMLERLSDKLQTLSDPVTLEDYYRLAGTQIAQEDYPGALESIYRCIELDDGSNQELHLDLLMKQGCLLVMMDRNQEALIPLDQVLAEDPSQTDAMLVKAQIYANEKDMDSMIRMLILYLEHQSGQHEIRKLLAQALFAKEDYSEAKKQYEAIIQNPLGYEDLPQIYYLHGMACIQLGAFSDAEKSLLKAIEHSESYEGIYYYIGVCKMSLEAYDEAIRYFSMALQQNSMTQLSYYSRGICGLMVENYDVSVAMSDLRIAAEYSGADSDESVCHQAAELYKQISNLSKQE